MKKIAVLNKNGKVLFVGSKDECKRFVRLSKYNRADISMQVHKEEPAVLEEIVYETTAPIQPQGFFKRVYK